jgi:hypothetical protein
MIINARLGPTLLEYSHKKYGELATFGMMEQNWKFLSDYNIVLHHDIKVPKRREGDEFLQKYSLTISSLKTSTAAGSSEMHAIPTGQYGIGYYQRKWHQSLRHSPRRHI